MEKNEILKRTSRFEKFSHTEFLGRKNIIIQSEKSANHSKGRWKQLEREFRDWTIKVRKSSRMSTERQRCKICRRALGASVIPTRCGSDELQMASTRRTRHGVTAKWFPELKRPRSPS